MEHRRRSRANRRKQEGKRIPFDRRKPFHTPPEIEIDKEGGRLTLLIRNELVAENCQSVRSILEQEIDSHDTKQVVLDIFGVTFMDSIAVGMLVDIKSQLTPIKIQFGIINPTSQVRWLMEILRVDRLLYFPENAL